MNKKEICGWVMILIHGATAPNINIGNNGLVNYTTIKFYITNMVGFVSVSCKKRIHCILFQTQSVSH